MVEMLSVTFQVLKKEQRRYTSRGNVYVECDTDKGKIGVWGSEDNLTNIKKVESANISFHFISDRYVNPSWQQHSYWIPESAIIQIA